MHDDRVDPGVVETVERSIKVSGVAIRVCGRGGDAEFTLDYPISSRDFDPDLLTPEGMARVVRAAEDAGLDAVAFTDHPAPSRAWLEGGGHETFDVVAALGFGAAITSRVSLMTYLMVLPYRNPFLAAKSLATIDLLSRGRCTVVAGTGYLKSEFRALGVAFDERNALFDEAVDVMRAAWTTPSVRLQGRHFEAAGVAALPRPFQVGRAAGMGGGQQREVAASRRASPGLEPLDGRRRDGPNRPRPEWSRGTGQRNRSGQGLAGRGRHH